MPAARRVFVSLALMAATGAASAADLEFRCTDALASSMRELVPAFEHASGHRVKMTVANAGTIAARLEEGQPADLAIVLPPAWERLRRDGRIDPDTRIVIGKVGLGAFVRKGAAKPDFGTLPAFEATVRGARALAVRDPAERSPVGTYVLELFRRLGLSDLIKERLILTKSPPYEEVIRGDAEIGFSTLAEIAAEPRVDLLGPLPREVQRYNVFTTAVPLAGVQRQATAEFIRFVVSDESKAVLRAKGIETD